MIAILTKISVITKRLFLAKTSKLSIRDDRRHVADSVQQAYQRFCANGSFRIVRIKYDTLGLIG